jgi:polynucleotide 5'-kinase involved in rRNA processing
VEIPKGMSLLAMGPLRITVEKGSLQTRGLGLSDNHLVVRAWETFEVLALEDSELRTAGTGQIKPTSEAYPPQWTRFLEGDSIDGAQRILVAGETDTGKSTLCGLVANRFLRRGGAVSVLDTDVGQSNIGPPTTVGLGLLKEPALRITDAEYMDGYFAGDTSPSFCFDEIVEGTGKLASKASKLEGLSLIDTCGLVTGPLGKLLISSIIEATEPEVVVLLERGAELGEIKEVVDDCTVLPALPASRKNLEARRAFRRSQFVSCLRDSEPVQLFLSNLEVEGFQARRARKNGLDARPRMRSGGWALGDLVDMENAIVGLHEGDRFLGLGLINTILFDHNAIRINAAVSGRPDRLIIGNIRLAGERETRIFRDQLSETPG